MNASGAINLLITGDFYGGGRTAELARLGKSAQLFDGFDTLSKQHDVTITNLESVLASGGIPIPKSGPHLQSDPCIAQALLHANISLVTLANNHIMDYGEHGLARTIEVLEKNGLAHVGAGICAEEIERPFIVAKNGLTVAILNFAENEWSTLKIQGAGANGIDPVRNYTNIRSAKGKVAKVIVITHAGNELHPLPSPRIKRLFRFYVDAGADAVIGHHPHCVGGFEVYKGAPIYYSLGNFMFDATDHTHTSWNEGLAVTLNITESGMGHWRTHLDQSDSRPGVRLCPEGESEERERALWALNAVIGDDTMLADAFHQYVDKNRRLYLAFLEPHRSRFLFLLQRVGLVPTLMRPAKRKLLLNLLRCESHREVLEEILISGLK